MTSHDITRVLWRRAWGRCPVASGCVWNRSLSLEIVFGIHFEKNGRDLFGRDVVGRDSFADLFVEIFVETCFSKCRFFVFWYTLCDPLRRLSALCVLWIRFEFFSCCFFLFFSVCLCLLPSSFWPLSFCCMVSEALASAGYTDSAPEDWDLLQSLPSSVVEKSEVQAVSARHCLASDRIWCLVCLFCMEDSISVRLDFFLLARLSLDGFFGCSHCFC